MACRYVMGLFACDMCTFFTSVMREYECKHIQCERIVSHASAFRRGRALIHLRHLRVFRVWYARIHIARTGMQCECAHLRRTYACPVLCLSDNELLTLSKFVRIVMVDQGTKHNHFSYEIGYQTVISNFQVVRAVISFYGPCCLWFQCFVQREKLSAYSHFI